MLHSFCGQEITEPSAQILRLKLNHCLAIICGYFFKNILFMHVLCAYICTYACVSEGAHVSTCMWTIMDIVPPQRNNPLMDALCILRQCLTSHGLINWAQVASEWTTRIFSSLHWDYKFSTIVGIFRGFWVSDLGPQYCKKRALLTWVTSPILCFFRKNDVLFHIHKVIPKIQFL